MQKKTGRSATQLLVAGLLRDRLRLVSLGNVSGGASSVGAERERTSWEEERQQSIGTLAETVLELIETELRSGSDLGLLGATFFAVMAFDEEERASRLSEAKEGHRPPTSFELLLRAIATRVDVQLWDAALADDSPRTPGQKSYREGVGADSTEAPSQRSPSHVGEPVEPSEDRAGRIQNTVEPINEGFSTEDASGRPDAPGQGAFFHPYSPGGGDVMPRTSAECPPVDPNFEAFLAQQLLGNDEGETIRRVAHVRYYGSHYDRLRTVLEPAVAVASEHAERSFEFRIVVPDELIEKGWRLVEKFNESNPGAMDKYRPD